LRGVEPPPAWVTVLDEAGGGDVALRVAWKRRQWEDDIGHDEVERGAVVPWTPLRRLAAEGPAKGVLQQLRSGLFMADSWPKALPEALDRMPAEDDGGRVGANAHRFVPLFAAARKAARASLIV
jgi:hypothetical protein